MAAYTVIYGAYTLVLQAYAEDEGTSTTSVSATQCRLHYAHWSRWLGPRSNYCTVKQTRIDGINLRGSPMHPATRQHRLNTVGRPTVLVTPSQYRSRLVFLLTIDLPFIH